VDQIGVDLVDEWPLIGRDAELERVRVLYRRHSGGVVLVGAPGAGKTRLAGACLQLAESFGATAVECTATSAMSALPLGVFAPLLPSLHGGLASASDRTELVRRCREELLGGPGTSRIALLIDNAHLLDSVSEALVGQLAKSDEVFLIATVDDYAAGTDFVVSLWKNSGLERIAVEPLADEWIEVVANAVLGGPIDWATVRHLADASGGKPLILRELVLAARDDGVLRRDHGIWRLIGELPTSRRLMELVQARMADLGPDHRRLMELIAFGEPLVVDNFPEIDPVLLHELERRAMIVSEDRADQVQVRLAHHVHGQVIRESVSRLRVREILRYLADCVEKAPRPGPDDLLRVATWRLDCGGSQADMMLKAARQAQARYHYVLADRLARRSLNLVWTFEASLLAAQLAAALGRRAEAEAELEELAHLAVSDEQHARVALSRMDNSVLSLGHIELGLKLLEEAEHATTDQGWKDELTAKRASVLSGLRGPEEAANLAVPLLDRVQGRAFVWAAMVSAYALSRMGRFQQARTTTTRGRLAHAALSDSFDWPIWRHDFLHTEALAGEGRLTEARTASLALYRDAVDDGSVEAQAWFAWQLSRHAPDCGSPYTAANYGRLAVALFRELGRTQLEQFALVQLAAASAVAGRADEARAALEELCDLGLAETHYFPVERLQAEAWTALASGEVAQAADAFTAAIETARATGDTVGEAESLHALARIGQLDDQRRLDAVSARIDGVLALTRARHAAALAARDAAGLDDVAGAFSQMGARLLAAEASAAASRRWRATGHERNAVASERKMLTELRACENPQGAIALNSPTTARLTPGEMRTAMLASTGHGNREIADEFVVSIRTIQNQLQRVYEKLGIHSRSELSAALADYAG
jgi:DNA-binding CsgD family transcriptional regulator